MKPTTPLKAIRLRCLDCSAGSPYEVASCVCEDCPLFSWRFGKRPTTIKKIEKSRVLQRKGQLKIDSGKGGEGL